MKILFLSSWYPSDVNTTLGNFVQRHAESVALLNEVTTLYITKKEGMESAYEISDEIINQVRTVIVYFKTSPFDKLNAPKFFKKGIKYLQKNNHFEFDVVHHNVFLNSGYQALYLKNKHQLPFIVTEHWTGFHNKPEEKIVGLRKKLAFRIAKHSSVITPVSRHLAKAMKDFGLEGEYKVVYNVVDTELFKPLDKAEDVFRFIHVSHLGDDHKNISGMIRAFHVALEKNNNLELSIIGDGQIHPYVKLKKELGIADKNLTIKGEHTLAEVAEKVGKSHAMVLFSNYENLPCVIVEAFACGIPVISTDVGGISEIVKEGRGYLINSKHEESLSQKFLQMFEEYTNFDSKEIRNYAIENFGRKSIAEKYTEIYKSVIK